MKVFKVYECGRKKQFNVKGGNASCALGNLVVKLKNLFMCTSDAPVVKVNRGFQKCSIYRQILPLGSIDSAGAGNNVLYNQADCVDARQFI